MKLVCGVGINDAPYRVVIKESLGYVDGKYKQRLIWECPFYTRWRTMLTRCYSGKYPAYTGTVVCEEWLTFSNFKTWMECQDWKDKELDKDLIGDGSIYSPTTCLFVSQEVNIFISKTKKAKGFRLDRKSGKFNSYISSDGNYAHLGSFASETEAHAAYIAAKYEFAKQLAAKQTDCRIRQALTECFAL